MSSGTGFITRTRFEATAGMVEFLAASLSFVIGVGCSMMVCCIGMYLGLFAYLNPSAGKVSRVRAGLMSLAFSLGVVLVVAVIGVGFLALQIGLLTVTHDALLYVDIIGFAILGTIGALYLAGRNPGLPFPYIGPPTALSSMRGFRAAPLYGAFFGGPGAAHCTFMLVIPIVFLSLSSLNPIVIFYNFLFYAAGRTIPIVVVGTMIQDAQIRFVKALSSRSLTLNRVIGVFMIISGISLFFIR